MNAEIKISADGTGFITNLISEYGIYFLLIFILGIVLYKFSGKFLDLISSISSPRLKDLIIVIGVIFVCFFIYILINYAVENFSKKINTPTPKPESSSSLTPNSPLSNPPPPLPPAFPVSNGNHDIYGFVKDDRGLPINGVDLNIKLNGSNFVQTSGKDNSDGFYKFVGIPGIKGQDITIFPNKEGYMLLNGEDSVKAILGSERSIRLKLKPN